MNKLKNEPHLWVGLILIVLSFGLFIIEMQYDTGGRGPFEAGFFANYIISLVYFFYIWAILKKKFFNLFGASSRSEHLLLLVLFNISAFALNLSLPVFYESVTWLVILLLIENSLLVCIALLRNPGRYLSVLLTFVFAVCIVFHVYQTAMILPYSYFGFLGCLLIGLSLLLFVPLFYLLALIRLLRSFSWTTWHRVAFITGVFVPILTLSYHLHQWGNIEATISENKLSINRPGAELELPEWIKIAQQVPDKPLYEKYLKTGLVYQEYPHQWELFRMPGSQRFISESVHDPLVTICTLFYPTAMLDHKSKIKILNYLYNTRHQTGDRFWTGRDLSTEQVVTNVQCFPKYRLSFTEMLLTVRNSNPVEWTRQEEAFYTFQLPEGGVVTSLSLWIEGEERKAVLSSKKKAEKAYTTIVKREMRDPSVVYWMEGNKVRVRVFPCTQQEDRKFKIGVTAPLTRSGNDLIYHSISFQGPNCERANAAVYMVCEGDSYQDCSLDLEPKQGMYVYNGAYQPKWEAKWKVSPLDKKAFTYDKEVFHLEEKDIRTAHLKVNTVFLDLNSSWTQEELETIQKACVDKEVLALGYQGLITGLQLSSQQDQLPYFSLFPFYKVALPESSIVITKGDRATPNLEDLKGSTFHSKLTDYFQKAELPVHVYDLGEAPSDYMQTLKAFQVIDYNHVTLEDMVKGLSTSEYATSVDEQESYTIPQSGVTIVRTTTDEPTTVSKGVPDHLMRLYYYQQVLGGIGHLFFADSTNAYKQEDIIQLAEKANVVTPVSSLIVLETQQDYDRFGIKQNKDSLGNASIQNSGAAPEPHEWAMIVVGLMTVLFIYKKKKRKGALI